MLLTAQVKIGRLGKQEVEFFLCHEKRMRRSKSDSAHPVDWVDPGGWIYDGDRGKQ